MNSTKGVDGAIEAADQLPHVETLLFGYLCFSTEPASVRLRTCKRVDGAIGAANSIFQAETPLSGYHCSLDSGRQCHLHYSTYRRNLDWRSGGPI